MTQPADDLDQLTTVLDQIGSRLATDPEYREQLRTSENQAAALHAAGVSAALLSGVLEEAGAEESEVAAYGFDLVSPQRDPDAIIVNTICTTPKIGKDSCRNLTLTITIETTGPKQR